MSGYGRNFDNLHKVANEIYDLAYNIEFTSDEIRSMIANALRRNYIQAFNDGKKHEQSKAKNKK